MFKSIASLKGFRLLAPTALVLSLTAAGLVACVGFSWDEKVSVQAVVVYSDGTSPASNINVDALDLAFEMSDDIVVSRRIDFTYAQELGVALNTNAAGIMAFTTGDLRLSALKTFRECHDVCVVRDADTNVCKTYYRDCDDVLKTVNYGLGDIENTRAQLVFRSNGAAITLTGAKIEHGVREEKMDDEHGMRVWLQHDKFTLPMAAPAAAQGNGSQAYGKPSPKSLDLSDLPSSASKAAYLGEPVIIKDFSKLNAEQQAKVLKTRSFLVERFGMPAVPAQK